MIKVDALARNLKRLREAEGVSQYMVSRHLGLSAGTYSKYELGQRIPRLETLVKLAKHFNVTIDSLLK